VRVDLEPMRTTSVLLLFNLRKFEVNQSLISCKQAQREGGGKVEEGLEETESWVSSLLVVPTFCYVILHFRGKYYTFYPFTIIKLVVVQIKNTICNIT